MFKCLKDVSENGAQYFTKGKIYTIHHESRDYGYMVLDDGELEHIIGYDGEEWFDEHFEEISGEEYLKAMEEYYLEYPDHDKEEQEYIRKHIESEIEKAVSQYKEALEFYANKNNYKQSNHELLGSLDSAIQLDEGEIARKALENK